MITERPSVSVCIPVYNGTRYLQQTLDTICSQKGIDLEIIISDDQSTDQSVEIIRNYQSRNTSFKWVVLESHKRLGMAKNWNSCLQVCTQEFVKVMGQDDLIYPGALFAQAALLMEYPKVGLAVGGCDILNCHGRRLFKRPRRRPTGIYDGNRIIHECLARCGNLIGESVTVMARRIDFLNLGGFSEQQRYFIDLDMWFRLLKDRDFGWMSESQAGFRIHAHAVSSSSQRNDFDQFDSLPFAADYENSLPPVLPSLRKMRARFATVLRNLIYSYFG